MNLKGILTKRILYVPVGVWLLIFAARGLTVGAMAAGRAWYPPANQVGGWMTEPGHPFIDHLANFDGAWYVRVAALGYKRLHEGDYDLAKEKERLRVMDERGYQEGKQGFGFRHFPFFPYVIRVVQKVFGDWTLSGLIVTNIFSFIFLLYLFRLTEVEIGEKAAWWAVAFATLAPNAHYLVALYSEGLLLAGMVASVYYARRNQWVRSMICGIFASTSRFEGMFIVIALFFILLEQSGGIKNALKDRRMICVLAAPSGILFPFFEFWRTAGSPFAVLASTRKALGVAWLWPWESFSMAMQTKLPFTFFLDVPVLIVALVLLILTVRRLRGPLAIWTMAIFFVRVSQPYLGFLRLFMDVFTYPIYLGDFTARRPWFGIILLTISVLLLMMFSVLFADGYWIA